VECECVPVLSGLGVQIRKKNFAKANAIAIQDGPLSSQRPGGIHRII